MIGFLIIVVVVSGLGWLIEKLIGWLFVRLFYKDEKDDNYYKRYEEYYTD